MSTDARRIAAALAVLAAGALVAALRCGRQPSAQPTPAPVASAVTSAPTASASSHAEAVDVRACMPAAAELLARDGGPDDRARAEACYEQACDLGALEACGLLGKLLEPRDPARAADLLWTACANSFASACDEGAAMFREGRGVPRDDARAHDFEEQSRALIANGCEMFAEGCDELARRYARGIAPADLASAMSHLRIACARGVAEACRMLAAHARAPAEKAAALARARDLADPTRTKAMLERSCDGGTLADCWLLGDAFLRGEAKWNVPKDVARGRELVLASCKSNDTLGVECRTASALREELDAGE